jgi:flagellar biosynthesis activator protein FlaF
MHSGAQAYSNTQRTAVTPRDREAMLLIKAASQLQFVKDNWDDHKQTLRPALTYNRKLWTVLVTSITREENTLPIEIKNNIGSLGVFIFQQTLELEAKPTPEKLNSLISINRELAAGLHGN